MSVLVDLSFSSGVKVSLLSSLLRLYLGGAPEAEQAECTTKPLQ